MANWTTADITRQIGRSPGDAQFSRSAQDKGVAARLRDVWEGRFNMRSPSAIMEHAS
ncbi:hypothetical protein [Paraburkholderia fungorum]|jgi:hypothetical protein|uniref:hypothetical protein n=1 Tax=Paraburkholderia fungorum TaxID=134537 RepID=UPI0015B5B644|nr:hypothetical protein [Paraburkholderia fungorum]MBU7443491.1 hypothetical protein [Paraburkholderia fungorum]